MAKVYELLSRQLIGLGSDTIFGLVGSGNFFLAESLVTHGAKFVAARHEAGALAMADAWARLTQKVGICTVHMGPGFTNIITPLVEAAKARTPLLVLTADVSTGAVTSTFAIDIDALATASGAIPERLWKNSTATQDLVRAYRRARYERRPVVFVMPQDIQAAESTAAVIAPEDNAYFSVIPDRSILEKIVSLVRDSRHPLILAGRGSVLAGARAGLEKLAEAIGALLATTANAHGLFAGNPWSIGIAGGFSSPGAVELFRQADLILAFGASLTVWTRRHGRLFPVVPDRADRPRPRRAAPPIPGHARLRRRRPCHGRSTTRARARQASRAMANTVDAPVHSGTLLDQHTVRGCQHGEHDRPENAFTVPGTEPSTGSYPRPRLWSLHGIPGDVSECPR